MDIYHSYKDTVDHQQTVVAIGNFDGLHRGHRALLNAAKHQAASTDLSWAVLTFSPHPAQVLAPRHAPPILMTIQEKAAAFRRLGVDRVWFQTFSKAFADLTPEGFVADVLKSGLGAQHVVVGFDFCFGKNRAGNVDVLRSLLSQNGMGLTVVDAVEEGDEKVSSSVIRRALSRGQIREANQLLGWSYSIQSQVLKGDARGRTMGFPTMNLALQDRLHPAVGVYAGWVAHGGTYFQAVANLGTQPTVGAMDRLLLEVHAIDTDLGSMYDQEIEFIFAKRLRDVRRFEDLDALQSQIQKDIAIAQTTLATQEPKRLSAS